MIFSRYGVNADRILKMEPQKGFDFYNKALEEIAEDKFFLRWIHGYHQTVPYDEFKSELLGGSPGVSSGKEVSQTDIFDKVANILRKE